MAHFAFIESNTTGTGRLALERLLDGGHEVSFFSRRPELYPFLEPPRRGLAFEALETNDLEALGAALESFAQRRRIDVVLTFSEYYVAIVAEVARRLGLRYLDPRAAAICRSKAETRRVLRAAGCPVPRFDLARSLEEARSIAGRIDYPAVVKPVGESSSQGVLQVAGPEELEAQFRALHGARENARGQALTGEVLIESLLEGPEYSVETLTLERGDTRIVGIVDKYLSEPPLFVELGHDFPSTVGESTAEALVAATRAALDAVGYDFGPAHTELRLTARGPVVVEINPRLAGGMIPELVRYATGVDLLTVWLDQLQLRSPELEPTRTGWASIRFFTAPRRGVLRGAVGLEEARALPTVREVSLDKPMGGRVEPAEKATQRLGQVIAAGDDRHRVLDDVTRARDLVRFEIEDG